MDSRRFRVDTTHLHPIEHSLVKLQEALYGLLQSRWYLS
jgi:hypothetical protein